MTAAASPSQLIAILGAGKARRFGADKLAQPCAGKPLGQWVLEAARTTRLPLVWIAGDARPGFAGDTEIVANPRATEGMGTSVALAARIARARKASALIILLADMPLVTPALIGRLLEAGAPAACRQRDGRPGVPALLPPAAYAALAVLHGDRGAGALMAGMTDLTLLDCAADELLDVDSPEMLAEAERRLKCQAAQSGY